MLAACSGNDDAQLADEASNAVFNPAGLTRPDIQPTRTPPTKLVTKDLGEGVGSPSREGDELTTEYYAEDVTGKVRYSSWDKIPPFHFSFDLGAGGYMRGLEEGLEGMKVGVRRELRIPPELTDTLEPLFYVIDLLEINRGGRCWSAQPLRQAPPQRQDEIREVCISRARIH